MKKLNYNPLLKWIQWRIGKNKNAIIIINGNTGSGKSYAGISLAQQVAEELGTNFSIANNVSFNFIDLLKKAKLSGNEKPGTCFLMEEVGSVGSGSSSKEWMSKANAFFNSFMQTSRHRNQILIMTCPSFSNLDASSRRLVHCQISMIGIDFNKNVSRMKPYVLQVNDRTGKIYFKYLRFKIGDGKGKLKVMSLPKPDQRTLNNYEKIKLDFTSKLNQRMIDESESQQKKRDAKVDNKLDTKVDKRKVFELIDECYTNENIAKIVGVSVRTVSRYRNKDRTKQHDTRGPST